MSTHHDQLRATPDPQQAEALRRRLHARLAAAPTRDRPSDPDLVELKEHTMSDDSTSGRRFGARPLLVTAAAVVATVGLVALIATVGSSDESPSASTDPVAPTLTDQQIASATLLADGEYAPGFLKYTPTGKDAGGSGIKMDRDIAARVPACAPFLDTAFESSRRPAVVEATGFTQVVPAIEPEYVVVFPNEDAAVAMFHAVTDPAFVEGCVGGYGELIKDPPLGTPEYVGFPYATFGGTPVDAPAVTAPADQLVVSGYHEVGNGTFSSATLRVGRIVVIVEGLLADDAGRDVLGPERFDLIVHRIVERATAALNGTPIP